MSVRCGLLLAMVLFFAAASSEARDPRPLRSAVSENGQYRLEIRAGRKTARHAQKARAIFARVREGHRDRIWRETLVNDVAPRRALIRNDGQYVVTLGEYRRGGAAHALVVYDKRGKLLREFDVRELLERDDWRHVKIEGRAIEWLTEAKFAFQDQPQQFVIKLKWGREIRIDLETARLVGADGKPVRKDGEAGGGATSRPASEINAGVPPEILALLEQATSAPTSMPAGQGESTGETVLQALMKLQQMAEASGVDVDVEGLMIAAGMEDAVAALREGRASAIVEESGPAYAGNSAAAGFGIPLPNPADPVDYLAFVMEMTETDGPSAVPYYKAAVEARVPWEGDQELYEAARRGDPEALASPEIAAWLEANQEALANFRAATNYDYRGMVEIGEDDTLIGMLLPKLSDQRRLVSASLIEAKYLESQGDVGAALGNYLDNFESGVQISQGPTLIENLVGIAVQRLTAEGLLDSFASETADEIDYRAVAEELEESYRPLRPMVEVFQGERAMMFDVIQRAYDWNPETGMYRVADDAPKQMGQIIGMATDQDPDPGSIAMSFMLGGIGFENMVNQVNEHYDELTEAAMLPYQESKHAFEELDQRLSDMRASAVNPLMSALLPALGRANHISVQSQATRNATRLVTNLKAYRQQYGEYPDSLEVFGDSDMVVDPFTGAHFAYRRDGDDFSLYSLGDNGIDDGGVHDRRRKINDVVYWPRPPRD